jgi:hypothetical protein
MGNFIVNVDNLTDDQLAFYGWFLVDKGDEFSTYWNSRHDETQTVSNKPPRHLMIDDWNDAQYMSRDNGSPVIKGPQRH